MGGRISFNFYREKNVERERERDKENRKVDKQD
jgi:hypothetical protein